MSDAYDLDSGPDPAAFAASVPESELIDRKSVV